MSDDIKPDGTKAKNVKEYVDAWRSLAAEVTACIPGAELHSFDPGLGLLLPRHHVVQHVPIEVARALAAERAALRESRSDRDLLDGMLKVAAGGIADLRAIIIEHLNMEGLSSDIDRRMAALVGWPEESNDGDK